MAPDSPSKSAVAGFVEGKFEGLEVGSFVGLVCWYYIKPEKVSNWII